MNSSALFGSASRRQLLSSLQHPHLVEETPLHLSESVVEVAADYTKRKNVFRVKTTGDAGATAGAVVGGSNGGSAAAGEAAGAPGGGGGGGGTEFLFQAEGEDSMREWVSAIDDTSAALAVVLADGSALSAPTAATAAHTSSSALLSSTGTGGRAAALRKLMSVRHRSPSAHAHAHAAASSPATRATKGSAGECHRI